ncbi:MAG TPA: IS1595 family transposase [Bryobacteraceae bacterium]|nr:IS1595 family transposase [Bryobacteraceae bacterium]
MNIIDAARRFSSEESALDYLENLRWPDGVRCLMCGGNRISKYNSRTNRKDRKTGAVKPGPLRYLYECLEPTCKHQFTATTGTIFHDTHLPLEKWLLAVALMVNAKKGLSAKQVQRDLDVSYQTAWYLCHRIREAMGLQGVPTARFTGEVEADETYIGGKYDKRRKRERWDKEPVFGIVERGGKVRTWHIPEVNRFHIIKKLRDNISIEAKVYTDESQMYKRMPNNIKSHEIVNHSEKEWVRGDVHTGTIDGYWGLFKRGLIGSFHQVSVKHLQRYLDEFQFRWNNRDSQDIFTLVVMALLIGKALQYKTLTAKVSEPALPSSDEPDEPF